MSPFLAMLLHTGLLLGFVFATAVLVARRRDEPHRYRSVAPKSADAK